MSYYQKLTLLMDNQQPAEPVKNNKLSDQENCILSLVVEGTKRMMKLRIF